MGSAVSASNGRLDLVLHPLGSFQTEKTEAGHEDAQGDSAEGQPRRPHLWGDLQHGAVLVERCEGLREMEQVSAQSVGLEMVTDVGDHIAELE